MDNAVITITDSNVTVMVSNMDRAISFYQSLGLKLKDRWGDHYAMVTAPGVTIGIHPSKDKGSSGTVSIGFMINDLAEARTLLQSQKIQFKEVNDKSGVYLHFSDHDGTTLYYVKPQW